jgi:RNA polymerase sigma-70 factor (ECF subfamily)
MTPATDNQLAAQALAGSADAFRQLVERFERPVLSVIQRLVGDPALAEDLAQETFLKVYRHLGKFDGQRKLSSWLFKIAHNTTLDHLRRKHPEMVPLEASSDDGGESWEVLPAPEEQNPDRRAEQAETATGIAAALGRLKPHYREMLVLRFQQGLAYHEIAEVMDLKMGTVKIQLHRARKQLATELAGAGFAPPQRFAQDRSPKKRSSQKRSPSGVTTTDPTP